MTKITASDVASLRKITGAGMMDCKQALIENNGDVEKAIEHLRKKGQKIAAKREDRDAKEGCVLSGVTQDKSFGATIVLNCETDFVAKNEDFIAVAQSILNTALENKTKNKETLLMLTINGETIEDIVTAQMGKIGEKIELSYLSVVEAQEVVAYVHPGNRLATLVGFNQTLSDEQMGKDVAMQVAAMNPVSIDKNDCPTDIIEKEIEIGKEQARQEGKPEAMLEKIALGKLNKFYKESTLLNQDFVKDSKQTISQYLSSVQKNLTVTAFDRFSLS
ncbi:MAG: translation elongation factor Ts [Bacteroidales bacterium]|nr:translation elongation factor Ts [Bacteroidales bacterium]